MTLGVTRRSKGALAGLRTHLQQHGWRQGATRLLLHDVYVRSVLTYGSAIWGVDMPPTSRRRPPASIRALEVVYNRGIRQLLGVSRNVRLEILHAVAARPPLGVIIRKAVHRYHRGLWDSGETRLVA